MDLFGGTNIAQALQCHDDFDVSLVSRLINLTTRIRFRTSSTETQGEDGPPKPTSDLNPGPLEIRWKGHEPFLQAIVFGATSQPVNLVLPEAACELAGWQDERQPFRSWAGEHPDKILIWTIGEHRIPTISVKKGISTMPFGLQFSPCD